jgi:signal transduction histidine kinase
LADASLRLLASTDEEATYATLSRLCIPMLADGACIFSLRGDDVQCRAVAHADPAKERFALAFASALASDMGKRIDWVEEVFRLGRCSELSGQTLAHSLTSLSNDPDIALAVKGLDIHWLEAWPLVAQHRVLGAIVLFGGTLRHEFGMAGEDMLQSLAHCASLAVDNVQMHEHARQSIRAREWLMAVAAHDLRNSLSLALMSLSTLDQFLDGSAALSPASRILLVRKGLSRMQRLVDDLLDFSSIEVGHLSISTAEQSVAPLVDEALDAFREAAAQKGIRLLGRKPSDACRIECDAQRILQVLSNLLGNALKFTPAGGEITVAAVDCGDEVEFFVTDTGCGIAPAEVSRIFEAYHRAARSRSGGVGLGLTIARGIVESHGGKMRVESRLGNGTTFFFRLPKRAPAGSKNDNA